jgi:predicted ATPase
MPSSIEVAEEMLRLSERQDDASLKLASHRTASSALYFIGAPGRARVHQGQVLQLYDRDRHRPIADVYTADHRVVALSFLSVSLLGLGYPDQARANSREALAYAGALTHPQSVGFALNLALRFNGLIPDVEALRSHAEDLATLAAEHGFTYYQPIAAMYLSCARALLGAEAAISECLLALAAYRRVGRESATPLVLGLLAEAYRRTGRPEMGLDLLREPLDRIERTKEGWIEAELHRLKGNLLLSLREPHVAGAESCFSSALAIARGQSARMWEPRAAMDLARLWRDQGRCAEACDLLAPVYGWFTEGFDLLDLRDARALLDTLD